MGAPGGGADRLVRHHAREGTIESDRVREGAMQLRRPHAFILTLDPSSPRAIHSFALKRGWRQGGGGRSIAMQANQMQLMGVIPQRAVANTDFPQRVPAPITAPPAGTNPLLVTRSIAVAAAPP